jgi:hypothetical protein
VSIVQPGVFKTGIVTSTVTGADSERARGYGLEDAHSRLKAVVDAMHNGRTLRRLPGQSWHWWRPRPGPAHCASWSTPVGEVQELKP